MQIEIELVLFNDSRYQTFVIACGRNKDHLHACECWARNQNEHGHGDDTQIQTISSGRGVSAQSRKMDLSHIQCF